ncbi:efflux RND transporter permease subunit [Flammeovirga sp. SJP92]|uniref:efflux RND transporter permease subunit n=1 Tax=Flammeovirga sp. SJP92 TaxID=1775430 RepID=UPI0007868C63|nr:efflux RND transporter permease subunit [Flammeovirga sp. SJP92]KXX72520.1 acriflavin resistance protein [Flammeovirga sp. SJP92]
MKKLVTAFVEKPFYAHMSLLLIILLGGIATYSMRKASFPLIESRIITVTVMYQGASPKEMDEGVTTLIENEIRGIPGIKETRSVSAENVATVTVTTEAKADIDEVLTDVKNAVDGISNFPAGAEKPSVSKTRATTSAMFLDLKGENLRDLKNYAQRIEDDFLASGKISQIAISGFPNTEISVEVDEDLLRRYNISIDDIKTAISNNNLDITGGTIKNEREEIAVLARYRSSDPDKIKDIVVRATTDGRVIKVGDLADVHYQFADVPNAVWMNGKNAISIQISKLHTEDLQNISEYINEYKEEFNATHDDAELIIGFDFLSVVNTRLDTLVENGLLGIILVVITLSLFLSFRLSLWVAWGIPSSFLGMFIFASLMGVTLNMISLFGMILIIGILVDDGIVIGENIFTHYEMGKSPINAAIDGTMEVIPAVLTSVSTTIIAFFPFLFLESGLEMMAEMALVVILCLLFSLFEGMFLLPSHVSSPKVLTPRKDESKFNKVRKALDRVIFTFRDKIYVPILRFLLDHKWFGISIPAAAIIITVGLIGGRVIELTFFPSPPGDFFNIDLALKPGIHQDTTKTYLMRYEDAVWEANEALKEEYNTDFEFFEHTFVSLGSAFSGSESGTHTGSVFVIMEDLTDSPIDASTIKAKVNEIIGEEPTARKLSVGANNMWGAPVSISLLGYNYDELEQASDFLKAELNEHTSLYNVMDNNQIGGQEIRLHLKPKAYALGFTEASLMSQVRNGFFGAEAQRLQVNKDEIRIYVRYKKENRNTLGDLERMRIRTVEGLYPLSLLADFNVTRGPVAINHYNGEKEIKVDAYMLNAQDPVIPIIEDLEKSVLPELEALYPSVRYEYQGQLKSSKEDSEELVNTYAIAFLLIIMILMLHFRSFTQAAIVLAMIPLGIIGAMWGHGIEGQTISMFSMLGMVALSGTIINDAVVYLSKFNQDLLSGMKFDDALINAGKSRFRPILLTTLTTTIGLYPMILETSPQSRFLVPVAISLAYGIMIGTVFILTILPVLVKVINDARRGKKWVLTGKKPSREEVENVFTEIEASKAMKAKDAQYNEDNKVLEAY